MLQTRVTRRGLTCVVVVAVLAGGCSGSDGSGGGSGGGVIEDNVIRPGITAIDESKGLACDGDASTLRTAIETYEALNGALPDSELVLVTDGFLREESVLWDIVGGELVPADPACGSNPAVTAAITAPATTIGDIVTSAEALSAEELLAQFSPDDIAEVGGADCARELAAIFSASERFIAQQQREPDSLDDLQAAGYLDQPITLWQVSDDRLVPADGSPCVDLDALEQAEACVAEARTLAVAREAYMAATATPAEPTEADLVTVGYLPVESGGVDLVDGTPVAAAGGPCEAVDLGQ